MQNFYAFRCFHCQKMLAIAKHGLCCRCLRLLKKGNYCGKCGAELLENVNGCGQCAVDPPEWQRLVRAAVYADPLADWIHRFKFRDQYSWANALARLLLLAIKNAQRQHYLPLPEVIMPVPLHWRREWQRGYNQSLLIAQPLSKWLNIPLDSTSLQRLRHTPPQHELSGAKRRRNLKNAFHYSPALPYRKIALVDDVVTTGSTMNTISQLLHQHGVEEVQVWCLARA